jgi:hypothetical protein
MEHISNIFFQDKITPSSKNLNRYFNRPRDKMSEKNSNLLIASIAIITTFAGLNDHFYPINFIFFIINNQIGRPGTFVFSGIVSAIIYLILSKLILKIDYKDNRSGAKKVALVSYILLAVIWGFFYLIFKPT